MYLYGILITFPYNVYTAKYWYKYNYSKVRPSQFHYFLLISLLFVEIYEFF